MHPVSKPEKDGQTCKSEENALESGHGVEGEHDLYLTEISIVLSSGETRVRTE